MKEEIQEIIIIMILSTISNCMLLCRSAVFCCHLLAYLGT